MRCPTLSELPSPPPGKTGWPWMEASPQLLETLPDGSPWPRISIVTPSYNQGQFLEETIRSVLLQGYPDLEYIIIDGCSTDDSVDIIRKYEPWLAYWVSKPDEGQSQAINKGFAKASGDILAWLNSDDTYEPGAVRAAVEYLQTHSDVGMVYGDYNVINQVDDSRQVCRAMEFSFRLLISRPFIPQQTAFWRREVANTVGKLNEGLHYVMDQEYWIRIGRRFKIARNPVVMANFVYHDHSKTVTQTLNFQQETIPMLNRLFADNSLPEEWRAFRNDAYSNVYCEMGKQYLALGDRTHARQHLWSSITTSPFRLSTGKSLIYLMDAVVGTSLGDWLVPRLRELMRRLRSLAQTQG